MHSRMIITELPYPCHLLCRMISLPNYFNKCTFSGSDLLVETSRPRCSEILLYFQVTEKSLLRTHAGDKDCQHLTMFCEIFWKVRQHLTIRLRNQLVSYTNA
jgi:hypothetical protein